MSPFGAVARARGSLNPDANSSTWNPGGTCGDAPAGRATTRASLLAERVAYGAGRSSTVILRRTVGASARQSVNAAAPVSNRPRSAASAPSRAAAASSAALNAAAAIANASDCAWLAPRNA